MYLAQSLVQRRTVVNTISGKTFNHASRQAISFSKRTPLSGRGYFLPVLIGFTELIYSECSFVVSMYASYLEGVGSYLAAGKYLDYGV